jgi:hypothetical protein
MTSPSASNGSAPCARLRHTSNPIVVISKRGRRIAQAASQMLQPILKMQEWAKIAERFPVLIFGLVRSRTVQYLSFFNSLRKGEGGFGTFDL